MIRTRLILCVLAVAFANVCDSFGENKYSEKMNTKSSKEHINFRTLEKPFRMAKLNVLWVKAQIRLTEPKLKSLYSDLKIQDKEELGFKRIKSEGLDKDGMKEAELRRKLTNIMKAYDLLEHFEDGHIAAKDSKSDSHMNKSLFQDKKLQKLWQKAEMAGFTSEELQALKEEFLHHQDKIDQYYSILNDIETDKANDIGNAMDMEEKESFNDISFGTDDNNVDGSVAQKTNMIRKKHNEITDGFDKLQRMASQGPLSRDFIEPKVQMLWASAMKANFKPKEMESLRVELKHYEARLLKLRHMQADHATHIDAMDPELKASGVKPEAHLELVSNINKQMRKVEKLHIDIENKINARHAEL